MKGRIATSIILSMMLTTTDWVNGIHQQPNGKSALAAPTVDNQPGGWIIRTEGKVEVKRQGQSSFQRITVGKKLYRGDLLRTAAHARVRVQCADLKTIWRIPVPGIVGALNRDFEKYLGLSNSTVVTLNGVREMLRHIETATGVRPAIIYAMFVPARSTCRTIGAECLSHGGGR